MLGLLIRGVTPFWRASKTTNQPIQAGKPPRCRDPISTNQPGAARPCRDAVSTNQPDMLDPAGWLQQLFFQGAIFGDKNCPCKGTSTPLAYFYRKVKGPQGEPRQRFGLMLNVFSRYSGGISLHIHFNDPSKSPELPKRQITSRCGGVAPSVLNNQ